MIKRVFHSDRSFLDLLFNCLLGFVFLFVVSFLMIEVGKKKANITTKAEYIITVTWDTNNKDDVDIWLLDPQDNLIWFNKKSAGLMHLDRDDVGIRDDMFTLPDGTTVVYPYNQEIVTIRGFIPGLWVLNLHMYAKRWSKPATVIVKMEKLNPNVKMIFNKTYTMRATGDEITVARFEMDSTGELISLDEVFTEIISQELTSREPTGEEGY